MSSSSEIPSSVRSLRSFHLRGMCSLHLFAAPISSARNASISPAFWRNRLLFLQAHRETDRFFAASGVQLAETDRGQFHFRLKGKVGLTLAKVAALLVV